MTDQPAGQPPADQAAGAAALLASAEAAVLWEPLRADGYRVDVLAAGRQVRVQVRAGEVACADCLVPTAVLRDIVLRFLHEQGAATDGLELTIDPPAGH